MGGYTAADLKQMLGAVNGLRGLLEFWAGPASSCHDRNFDKGKTVIVYCVFCARSALAGKGSRDMGHKWVHNTEGLKDLAVGHGPVEKASQPPCNDTRLVRRT